MQRKIVVWAIPAILIVLLTLCVGVVIRILIYEPPLAPAPGYSAFWATEPNSFGASAAKSWANIAESRPCTYELLGWTRANVLHFRESCGDVVRVILADPRAGETVVSTTGDFAQDISGQVIAQVDALDLVRSVGTRPVSAEPYTRAIEVRGDAMGSTDGVYVALISRQIYGPEDVLILWRSDANR